MFVWARATAILNKKTDLTQNGFQNVSTTKDKFCISYKSD